MCVDGFMCIYRDHPFEENFAPFPRMTSDFQVLQKSWSVVVFMQRQSVSGEDKQWCFGGWNIGSGCR